MSEFKVGDRVRCIDNSQWDKHTMIITKFWKLTEYIQCHHPKNGTGSFFRNSLKLEGVMSLRSRIEALDNGWDKEADDILAEIIEPNSWYSLQIPTKDIEYTENKKVNIRAGETGDILAEFKYTDQCSKMTAFKDALLWLLDKSGLEGHKAGDNITIESEGKTYKVKILEEIRGGIYCDSKT